MFIKLYRKTERTPIWVNMNQVFNVESTPDGGSWLEFKDSLVVVKESPEEIFSVISYFSCNKE